MGHGRQLEVVSYRDELSAEWDAFVARSINGNLFHTRRFLAYHPSDRFADASVLVRQGGALVSVLPAAWIDGGEGRRDLVSHPGASHGGPVFSIKASAALVSDVLAALDDHARARGAAAVEMRLPPHVFHLARFEELEFLLRRGGFAIARSELSSALLFDGGAGDVMDQFSGDCRKALRKAMASGLVGEESDDYAQFWEVLRDNLAAAHGVSPTHSLEELEELRRQLGDGVRLFVARDGQTIAAGTLVFVCNPRLVHTFYIASRKDHAPRRPVNLALYAAARWAREQGFAGINFGVSTPQGRSVNWGLLRFKEGFGGRGVLRDTYRKSL